MDKVWQEILTYVSKYGLKVVISIVVLVVGFKLTKLVVRWTSKFLEKSKLDKSLEAFLTSCVSIILKGLIVILVISILDIETTAFAAIIGAFGLAIGFSLQGSLANFAGGVLILILKPFKVDDLIEGDGTFGVVETIDIFYTKLRTPDNKQVVIPNAKLSNNKITNYTKKKSRRIDFKIGVGYNSDLHKTKEVLLNSIDVSEHVLKDPLPVVRLGELGDSAIVFYVWFWCESTNYWNAYFDVMEAIKNNLDRAQINIPYPQMDVHMKGKD